MSTEILAGLAEQVRTAAADQRPVLIRGGDTKAFYGNAFVPNGVAPVIMDMRCLKGIVNYQPSELVVTALAGTPLQEVVDTLDASGQMLAFEPPGFGAGATVGGCVSAGLSGPGRLAVGPLKDFVLGAHLLDAQGRTLKFGGEVMKNVAGYDVSRLLAGAMGSFGALTQISLKVAPKPFETCTLEWELDEAESLKRCHSWRAHPLSVSATAWESQGATGRLRLRLAGAAAALRSARQKLGGTVMDQEQAQAYWTALREQQLPFFKTEVLWRVAVAPGTGPLGLGPTLIEWGGGQRWIAASLDAAVVRDTAARAGGHATQFRAQASSAHPQSGVFHPVAPGLALITQRLKNEFDPQGLFNPGRLIPKA